MFPILLNIKYYQIFIFGRFYYSRSSRRDVQIDDNDNENGNGNEEDNQKHYRRMGGVTGLGLDLFGEEDRIKAVLGFLQDPVAFEKVRNKYINFNFF